MIEQVRDINTLGGTLNTNIDLGNLEQGMYFIRVIGNNGLSSVQRFIKGPTVFSRALFVEYSPLYSLNFTFF